MDGFGTKSKRQDRGRGYVFNVELLEEIVEKKGGKHAYWKKKVEGKPDRAISRTVFESLFKGKPRNYTHHILERIGLIFGTPLNELLAPPKEYKVPFSNPYFWKRNSLLSEIERRFEFEKDSFGDKLGKRSAIYGLKGSGKTQIALEYAQKCIKEKTYSYVFWSQADDLTTSYTEIADVLKLEVTKKKKSVAVVKAWMKRRLHTPWLLVIDNVEDCIALKDYLPENHPQGHILITTSDSELPLKLNINNPIEIPVFDPQEAKSFLYFRTGRTPNNSSNSNNDPVAQICDELGYLPLALEQAGAFVSETGIFFQKYLDNYRKLRSRLLSNVTPRTGDYKDSVATTWLMNFEAVQSESEASIDLLYLCAFLNPDSIPKEIITKNPSYLGKKIENALEGVEEAPALLDMALKPLYRYSLIRIGDNSSFSIHRLVQEVVRDRLDVDCRKLWIERAIKAVGSVFVVHSLDGVKRGTRYFSNAKTVSEFGSQYNIELEEYLLVLASIGCFHMSVDEFALAEKAFKTSLQVAIDSSGEKHMQLATAFTNISSLYLQSGQEANASVELERAYELIRHKLPADHPQRAYVYNSIGRLYLRQEYYDEAEKWLIEALKIIENKTNIEPAFKVMVLCNLVNVYIEMKKFDETEILLNKVTQLQKDIDESGPTFASILDFWGVVYERKGEISKAKASHSRAIEITRNSLNPDHLNLSYSLNSLGVLYDKSGEHEKAEKMLKEALEIRQKKLPEDHNHIGTSKMNLGKNYSGQNKKKEAESLLTKAVEVFKKSAHNLQLATAYENLALHYVGMHQVSVHNYKFQNTLPSVLDGTQKTNTSEKNDIIRAVTYLHKSLNIREQMLKADHEDTKIAIGYLISLCGKLKDYKKCEMYATKLLRIERESPKSAQNLSIIISSLGGYCKEQGKLQEAEKYFREALDINEKLGSEQFFFSAGIFEDLADIYWSQGHIKKVDRMLQKSLVLKQNVLPAGHPSLLSTLSKIEQILTKMQELRKSEKIGRNEKCWCGSGKKYKNCHLQDDLSP